MRIPLIKGRYFNERDTSESRPVAIIDQTLAEMYFPGEDPIGKRVEFQSGKPIWRDIVGVVGHVKHKALDSQFENQLYYPHAQVSNSTMFLVVRSGTDADHLTAAIRDAVKSVDKEQPIYKVTTMERLLSNSLAQRRLSVVLLGGFSAVAMILAAFGLYGVISYSVEQRTRELGVRIALGAVPGDILRLVLGEGMFLALSGVAFGVGGGLTLTRGMASLLYETPATDSFTFIAVSVLVTLVCLMGCFVPARRATRVDPMVALRYE